MTKAEELIEKIRQCVVSTTIRADLSWDDPRRTEQDFSEVEAAIRSALPDIQREAIEGYIEWEGRAEDAHYNNVGSDLEYKSLASDCYKDYVAYLEQEAEEVG